MEKIRPFKSAFMADARVAGERRRQVVSTRAEAEALLREWGCEVPARAPATEPGRDELVQFFPGQNVPCPAVGEFGPERLFTSTCFAGNLVLTG